MKFDIDAFLKGKVRMGTVKVPNTDMEIVLKELGAIERLKIINEYEDITAALMEIEKDAILAVERYKAGKATNEDILLIARYNSIAAPYYSALISACTVDPHLEPQDIEKIFNALNDLELQQFILDCAPYFSPPNIDDLKKNNGGRT